MSRVFDPGASWIPAQLKKPVREALDRGWTPGRDRIKAGGWFIYSPKRSEKFYIPTTCKDPDNVAKKLRSLVNKAYVAEETAFESRNVITPEVVKRLSEKFDVIQSTGPTVRMGPDPTLTCPDCDGEWPEMEGFVAHQEACRANVRAALAAEQAQAVPEEGDEADRPSEGVSQNATESTESTESVHSGKIGTKEETVTEQEPQRTKGKWTQARAPLHRAFYMAIRNNGRWKGETDSVWSRRLAEYVEREGLLDDLPESPPVDDGAATQVLAQIRLLVGGDEEEALREKNDALTKEIERMQSVLTTFSELAREATGEK